MANTRYILNAYRGDDKICATYESITECVVKSDRDLESDYYRMWPECDPATKGGFGMFKLRLETRGWTVVITDTDPEPAVSEIIGRVSHRNRVRPGRRSIVIRGNPKYREG